MGDKWAIDTVPQQGLVIKTYTYTFTGLDEKLAAGQQQPLVVAEAGRLAEAQRTPEEATPRTNGEGPFYGWWRPVALSGAQWRPMAEKCGCWWGVARTNGLP